MDFQKHSLSHFYISLFWTHFYFESSASSHVHVKRNFEFSIFFLFEIAAQNVDIFAEWSSAVLTFCFLVVQRKEKSISAIKVINHLIDFISWKRSEEEKQNIFSWFPKTCEWKFSKLLIGRIVWHFVDCSLVSDDPLNIIEEAEAQTLAKSVSSEWCYSKPLESSLTQSCTRVL